MRAKWLSVLGLTAFGLIAGIALAEALVRITGLASPPGAVTVNERQFREIPGVFVPQATIENRSVPRFPHHITVNSLGYRGAEVPFEPEEGEFRIFFAGDSFTWGDLVDDHETLPARLEAYLSSFCPGVRVINAGIGGTTIVGQREMIRRGLPLGPDLVLLLFYDNDVAEMAPPQFWDVMTENRRRKSTFPASAVYSVLNRSAIWVVARRTVTRLGQVTTGGVDEVIEDRDDAFWEREREPQRERYAEQFRGTVAELRDEGIPLLLASYPSHLRVQDPTVLFNHAEWLEGLAAGEGVPFLDLLPGLESLGLSMEDLYFLPWDGHARPIGYTMAAEWIGTEVLELDVASHYCTQDP